MIKKNQSERLDFAGNLFKGVVSLFFKVFFFFAGKPEQSENAKKAVELYKGRGFASLFTQIRLWDSPLEEISRLITNQGLIVDLGCGDGFLSNFLALSSAKRKLVGVELNSVRFKEADKGLKNTKFIAGDILKTNLPDADTFLLVHVLHHLPSKKSQQELLEKIYKKLSKGGKLIMVEIIKKPFLKYWFTYLTDAVIVPILFEKKLFSSQVHFRDNDEWIKVLNDLGFKVKTKVAHQGRPFSHLILIGEKNA